MKRWLVACGLLAILGGCALGAWRIYERHLSADLRRTLMAAADPDCSEADLRAYIREARLQRRTEKDRAVVEELEQAVALAADAEQQDAEYWQDWRAGMQESLGPVDVPQAEWDAHLRREKADDAAADKALQLEKSDAVAAKQFFAKFRADLGLPPLAQ